MKLSIILPFLLLFSGLFANHDNLPPSALKIVDYKLDQTKYAPFCTADIVLENGSHWKGYFHSYYKSNLDEWRVGDSIQIHKHRCLHYSLKNLNRPGTAYHCFNLDLSTENRFPKVEAIEDNGYLLILSDGSHWSVGYLSGWYLDAWGIGDRVIVTPWETSFGTTHALYNIDLESYFYINAAQMNSIDVASDS
ncbi:MAG: hypothetical protein H7A41_01820 [Chlamydiales bacterium]|nr:hypothetical protein [Chlamydiales bacterium]